ncbi:MAG: hypothetical protein ACD_50C00174G0004 [uncultured bacterium]|nr:MAG: hypothetical protein ACD_50C00174G0004 [uncultured bacterium]OGH13607.1 MAG: hypothetical protein A2687_05595 [Candidatus Levybacteria bacterium RIFCSPHIGHO2_01_FULL_38_26]
MNAQPNNKHKNKSTTIEHGLALLKKNKRKAFFILFCLFAISVFGFLTPRLFLTDQTTSEQNKTPSPTVILPTPTEIPPTQYQDQPTVPQNTPTPTTPIYKYILWKSTDEIRLTVPAKTGFSISATLRDEKLNIVTNQSGFVYNWTIDNPTLLKEKAQSFSGCTQGIQEPCPQDHFTFAASASGQTVIRVEVSKDGETVAATTFPLIIEETK